MRAIRWIRTAALAGLVLWTTAAAPPAGPRSMAQTCADMQAGPVAWVTLDEAGNIDQQVDSYPAGTTLITPVFEYQCVPRQATVVTVFTFNGETVHTDRESLRATNRKGLYGFPLSAGDQPFDDGEWGVQFYNGKALLTTGAVSVGGAQAGTPSSLVAVEGTVADKKSGRPIKGAVVLVLRPGVSVQQFLDAGKRDADVVTAGKSDSRGRFVLQHALERGVTYGLIIVARGYRATGMDAFAVAASAPDPLVLTVTMTK